MSESSWSVRLRNSIEGIEDDCAVCRTRRPTTIPVGRREVAGDAAGTARQIRRGPIADERLVDHHLPAEIGAVAGGAGDPRRDQMLATGDSPRQRRRLRSTPARGSTAGAPAASRSGLRRRAPPHSRGTGSGNITSWVVHFVLYLRPAMIRATTVVSEGSSTTTDNPGQDLQ